MAFSRDRGRIATYRNINYWPKDPVKFTVKVLDAELKQQWSKEVQLAGYTGEDITFKEYRVDDGGNVYMYVILRTNSTDAPGYPNVYQTEHPLLRCGRGTMTQHDLMILPARARDRRPFDFNDKQEIAVRS
ncbi:MAG: hypothetical protein IPO05_16780 [Flavobacteriales bacterium]|nr:hypothetical protein [Flavobacteriales bacterium]